MLCMKQAQNHQGEAFSVRSLSSFPGSWNCSKHEVHEVGRGRPCSCHLTCLPDLHFNIVYRDRLPVPPLFLNPLSYSKDLPVSKIDESNRREDFSFIRCLLHIQFTKTLLSIYSCTSRVGPGTRLGTRSTWDLALPRSL